MKKELEKCPICGGKVMLTTLKEWSLTPAYDCLWCKKRWFKA